MFSSKKFSSSKVVQYANDAGKSIVTETRTFTDSDGTRTETSTRSEGGSSGGFLQGIGSKIPGGQKIEGFVSDVNKKMESLGMKVELGGDNIVSLRRSKAKPTEARYSRGWSSRRSDKTSAKSALPVHPKGKTFEEIKQQCLSTGQLFEDPDFPAEDSSIFYSRSPPRPFVWKRPPELVNNPELFVGGASRFDVKQGELGDCWLLAAVACLTTNEKLLHNVVPKDQSFTSGYCGAFHFRFWRFGEWLDVIIDDRLPTYYDKLVFMHSDSTNEFWTALIEKAYAKVHGSYESLKGGATSEALEDFTGGMSENYDFRQNLPPNLFNIMLQAQERNSMMGCSIEAMPGKMEAELSNGLIMGHAYSVTAVKLMNIQTSRTKGKIPMVRVRNPWGNECEWKGAWSDKSQEWNFISEDERNSLGLTFGHDGEFWMSFADFSKNFQKLEIVHLGVAAMNTGAGLKWNSTKLDGGWKSGVNAGGCRNYLDTFWTNPQYRVEVTDTDDNDSEDMGTLIVALMQKNRRKLRKEGLDMLTCGYVIYKLKDPDCGPLDMRFFKYNASVAKSPAFINLREICGRHRLEPGHYCIIPSTFEPRQEGDFLVRIFSEKPNGTSEIDEETGMSDVQNGGKSEDDDLPPDYAPPPPPVEEVKEDYPGRRRRIVTYYDGDRLPDQFFDDGRFDSRFSGFRHDPGFGQRFRYHVTYTCDKERKEAFAPVEHAVMSKVEIPEVEVTDADRAQEDATRRAFTKVAGEDMEIDAYELKDILNAAYQREFKFDGFTAETCRSMVAMMDDDKSGKLGFEEFKELWTDLRLWKGVFKQYDADKSGTLASYELRRAFHGIGFKISNGTFLGLVQRYSHKDGTIHFDDFVHCVARMKTMFETFKEMRKASGKAEFELDEFIQTTMYS